MLCACMTLYIQISVDADPRVSTTNIEVNLRLINNYHYDSNFVHVQVSVDAELPSHS